MSQSQTTSRSQDDGRPDERQIETLLAHFEPVPGEAFHERMRSAPWTTQRGVSAKRLERSPHAALLHWAIAGLLLVTLIAATPQGRALAQEILQFFTRAEDQTRDISSELAPEPLPFHDQCGPALAPRCSVDGVRSMVEFPLHELGQMPEGMTFVGASGGPEAVFLRYEGERGSVTLMQAPRSEDEVEEWTIGPQANVEAVLLNGVAGEYVAGSWSPAGQAPEASVAWDDLQAAQTLRWETDEIRFTLVFRAYKTGDGPVFGRDDLVALARSLTSGAVASLPDTEHGLSPQAVGQSAGFPVQQPAWLPVGYAFDHATYSSEHSTACLYYRYEDLHGWPLLTIAQSNAGNMPDPVDWLLTPSYEGEPVQAVVEQKQLPVGGAVGGQGLLTVSGADTSKLCGGESQTPNMSLFWATDERSYALFGSIDQYDGRAFLTPLEMQRVAESLTGVATLDPGADDPGRLPSAEAAESLAGFDVRSPAWLPEGFDFSYAAYRVADGPEVTLLYLGSTRDSMGRSHGYVITQTTVAPNTLEELALGGDYEWTTVRGEPALYRQLCWDDTAAGMDASCYLELSWFEAELRIDFFVNLPGATVDREALLDMAESMR